MKKYAPTALAALALAGIALPLTASSAQAAETVPEINAATYDGSYFSRTELVDLTIGNSFAPSFATTNYGDTVRILDENGHTRCTTTAIWCDFAAPLTVGDHTLKAVTTRAGQTLESSPLVVHVVDDGAVAPEPDPAAPARPNPGVTDPGFGVVTPAPGLEAPKVVLGENISGHQKLIVTLPTVGNGPDGHVRVFDESSATVLDRTFGLGGNDLSLFVPGESGAKHTYAVEVETGKGVSPRTEVVVDNSTTELAAAKFAFAPTVISGGRLVTDIAGTPGSRATLTNSAGGAPVAVDLGASGRGQLVGKTVPGVRNEFSIVLTKGGETSAALTHVVDLTPDVPAPVEPALPNPGETDPGFGVEPGDEAGAEAPRVLGVSHTTLGGKYAVRLWIAPPADKTAKVVVTDENGASQEYRQTPTQEYLFVIGDRTVAHDLTVAFSTGGSTPVHVSPAE